MAKLVELNLPEVTLQDNDKDTVFKVTSNCVVELPLVRNVDDDEVVFYEFWIAKQGASIEFVAENSVTIIAENDNSYLDNVGAAVVVERWGGNTYAIAGRLEKKP